MRCIRKLFPGRRREDLENQDDKSEEEDGDQNGDQNDEQKNEKNHEQNHEQNHQQELLQDAGRQKEQPRMILILRDLQRTMDPLVAAQFYNDTESPLCRLPEELLLNILRCLGNDLLTMLCLRRVSRTIRRLINTLDIWERQLRQIRLYPYGYNTDVSYRLTIDEQKQLKMRLQRDGMCDKCILLCDVPVQG